MQIALKYTCICLLLALTGANAGADLESLLEPVVMPEEEPETSTPAVSANEITETTELPAQDVQKPTEVVLKATDLLPYFQNLLREKYSVQGGDIKIYPKRPWGPISFPGEDWEVEMIGYPVGRPATNLVINFRILSAGRSIGQWQWLVHCEVWRQVYVPKIRLKRGVSIDPSEFDSVSVDVLRHHYKLVPVDIDLGDYELTQSISPAKPLSWSDLKVRPVVRKGEVVEVFAEEGMLRITMRALAMENGAQGEFIAVRNLQSRKDIQAQVIGENKVKVFL